MVPTLTSDLQASIPDRHLQVRWSEEERAPAEKSDWDDPEYLAAYWAREAQDNFGFDKIERLQGNIGLIVVRNIDEPEGTAGVIDAAFAFLARCNALIIDVRNTTGGATSGIAYFLGHLLPAGTPLTEAINRQGEVFERTMTPAGMEPTFPEEVPVYALISARTVSGCEELVYDLRAAGRATLVGATTIGAANPVDVYPVDPHVVVRVPTAIVRNVATGSNWEGVGIKPDLECAPEDALDIAHTLASERSGVSSP
jgi:C-terminal processing protease CtpA/Prc